MAKHSGLSLGEMVLFGMLGALTFALKVCMAALPNIEPVSLMVMLCAAVFGWRALYPTYVYVAMEILWFGLGTWNFNYFYVWALLAVAAVLLRKMEHPMGWAMLSGMYGLMFGALCAPVDVAIGGMSYAVSKWISGIPFDVAHCAGNFVIALVLWKPLKALMDKLCARVRR